MSEVKSRRDRARESTYRRRVLISDPEIAGGLVMLIQQEEPRKETSWNSIWRFGGKLEGHPQEYLPSAFFLDSAEALSHDESGELYPEQSEGMVHPQTTYWWAREPTRLTKSIDHFEAAYEVFVRPELDWSPLADHFSRTIETFIEDDINAGETSKPDAEAPERVLESDEVKADLVPVSDESDAELVLKALENPEFSWRTLPGIAKETGLEPDTVVNLLAHLNGQVVRSSRATEEGEELFASRERFRQFASPWTKILGALKNRAD